MQWFKLWVLLLFLLLAVFSICIAGTDVSQTYSASLQSSPDVPEGAVGDFLWIVKMMFYAFIFSVFAVGGLFVLKASKIGVDILSALGSALQALFVSVRSMWGHAEPAIGQDTVVVVNGQKLTLKALLTNYAKRVVGQDDNGQPLTVNQLFGLHGADIKYLKELTSQLEPPPPPKTDAERLLELEQELHEARAQLAAVKEVPGA